MGLTLRTLQHEKSRFAASLAGVALRVLLVLFLVGVYFGFTTGASAYIDRAGGDVWVMQAGAIDTFHSVLLLPPGLQEQIASLKGVVSAAPIHAARVAVHGGERERGLLVVGFDPARGVGGPPGVEVGVAAPGPGEIVFSRVLADELGIGVGDVIHAKDHALTVVGLTRLPSMTLFTYAFTGAATARELLNLGDRATYFLVRAEEGADATQLAARIERSVPGVTALTVPDFGERNTKALRDVFVPILGAVVLIGFISALAIVSITTYSSVRERCSEGGPRGGHGRAALPFWHRSRPRGVVPTRPGATFACRVRKPFYKRRGSMLPRWRWTSMPGSLPS